MTIDLSNSTNTEILRAAKVLGRINAIARDAHFDYLVVGATARNIVAAGLLGATPLRQTRDVDIVTEVGSWPEFESLTANLDRSRGVHTFTIEGSQVDIVPYGDIEQKDRTILWPDDCRMNALGIREAVDSAEEAMLPGGVSIRVPSIPALALLKIVAWQDRGSYEKRDAVDLGEIVAWYSEGKHLDALYAREFATLKRWDYDPKLAGAWLFGSHMRMLLDYQGADALLRIARDDDARGRLAQDMGTVRASATVDALCEGIREAAAAE